MKSILYFVAVCFTVALIGCETTSTVSPGAISECGAKCGEACTKAKSECCGAAKCDGSKEVAPGAVSEKSGCSQAKSDCQKAKSDCQKAAEVSPGAVSETGCSKAKTDCSKRCPATGATGTNCTKEAEANLGAVSEKTGCSRPCGAKSE